MGFDSASVQLPADDKMTMHLTMGTLVIQGLINSTFAIQLRVSDLKGDQRRIHLSTAVLGIDCTVKRGWGVWGVLIAR